MKKIFRIASLAALFLLPFACTELDPSLDSTDAVKVKKTFSASFDEEEDTKSSLSDDYKVLWSVGDQVNIFGASTNTTAYASNLTEDNKRANFDAIVTEGDAIYALYPYQSSASFADGIISFNLPSAQTGSFSDANIAVASEKDGIFTFRNVTAIFEFSLDKNVFPTVTQVIIESLRGEWVSGPMTVEFSNRSPWIYTDFSQTGTGSTRVSVQLNPNRRSNQCYYAAIAPGDYNKGMVFHLADSNGNDVRTVTYGGSKKIIQSNQLYRFGDLANLQHVDKQTIFNEKFRRCNGAGGYDGSISNYGSLISSPDSKTDISGWQLHNCYEGKNCLAIRSNGSDKGYAITPPIGIDPVSNPAGDATVTFQASLLQGGSAYCCAYIVGNGAISSTSCLMGTNGMETVVVYVTGADAQTRIKFKGKPSGTGELYLGEIKVEDVAPSFSYFNLPEDEIYEIRYDQTSIAIPMLTNGGYVTCAFDPKNTPVVTAYTTPSTVNVEFKPNTTKNTTNFTIQLRSSATDLPSDQRIQAINFVQAGKPLVELSDYQLNFPVSGDSKEVLFRYYNFDDGNVTAVSSQPSQFSVSVQSGKVVVTAQENTSDEQLHASVTITVSDGAGHSHSQVVALTQDPIATMTLSSESEDFLWDADQASISATLKNFGVNATIEASSNNDAFTASVSGNTITINAAANTGAARNADITVTASDNLGHNIQKHITVTQAGLPSITVSHASLEYTAEGGEKQLTVTCINMDGTQTVTVTSRDGEAQISGTSSPYTVSMPANVGTSPLEDLITVSVNYKNNLFTDSKTITVSQEAKTAQTLTFPEASYVVYADTTGFGPAVSGAQSTVTYSCTPDDGVISCGNNGKLTISAANLGTDASRTYTISADAVATSLYFAGNATYSLTVYKAPTFTLNASATLNSAGDEIEVGSYSGFKNPHVDFIGTNAIFDARAANGKIYVSATANSASSSRSRDIQVKIEDDVTVKHLTIQLTQSGLIAQNLAFVKQSVILYYNGQDVSGTIPASPTVTGAFTTVTYSITENDFVHINSVTGGLTFTPYADYDGQFPSSGISLTVTANAVASGNYAAGQGQYHITYKRIPNDYAEVECVTSPGGQYIDTGVAPSDQTGLYLGFKLTSVDDLNKGYIFGSATNPNTSNVSEAFAFNKASNLNIKISDSAIDMHTQYSVDANTNYHTIFLDAYNQSASYDGASHPITVNSFGCTNTIYLFDVNSTATVTNNPVKASIYFCDIYESGALQHRLIPCQDQFTDHFGFFDVKTGDIHFLQNK